MAIFPESVSSTENNVPANRRPLPHGPDTVGNTCRAAPSCPPAAMVGPDATSTLVHPLPTTLGAIAASVVPDFVLAEAPARAGAPGRTEAPRRPSAFEGTFVTCAPGGGSKVNC